MLPVIAATLLVFGSWSSYFQFEQERIPRTERPGVYLDETVLALIAIPSWIMALAGGLYLIFTDWKVAVLSYIGAMLTYAIVGRVICHNTWGRFFIWMARRTEDRE